MSLFSHSIIHNLLHLTEHTGCWMLYLWNILKSLGNFQVEFNLASWCVEYFYHMLLVGFHDVQSSLVLLMD